MTPGLRPYNVLQIVYPIWNCPVRLMWTCRLGKNRKSIRDRLTIYHDVNGTSGSFLSPMGSSLKFAKYKSLIRKFRISRDGMNFTVHFCRLC